MITIPVLSLKIVPFPKIHTTQKPFKAWNQSMIFLEHIFTVLDLSHVFGLDMYSFVQFSSVIQRKIKPIAKRSSQHVLNIYIFYMAFKWIENKFQTSILCSIWLSLKIFQCGVSCIFWWNGRCVFDSYFIQ